MRWLLFLSIFQAFASSNGFSPRQMLKAHKLASVNRGCTRSSLETFINIQNKLSTAPHNTSSGHMPCYEEYFYQKSSTSGFPF